MAVTREVLGEKDPRFDMPANERYLASIHKKVPKFSHHLRQGIAETVALLGTRGENTPQGDSGGSGWRAVILVRELLGKATSEQWFSLAPLLPLLAEAAPDEFLDALENGVKGNEPAVKTLFVNDAGGPFSSNPHTSLMWALEILAWDVAHLSRVALLLARLVELDEGGRMNPRPAGVLHSIFLIGYPHTSATIDERLQALELLVRRKPIVAWSLLIDLIPRDQGFCLSGSKPRWRDCGSSQHKGITYSDIDGQVEWIANQLVSLAQKDVSKWWALVKEFEKLPELAQQATLQWLKCLDTSGLQPERREDLWQELRGLLQRHRFYHAAHWAMQPSLLDELAEIERKLAPNDAVVRNGWLFGNGGHYAFGDIETPFDEQERIKAEAQATAVNEVFETQGLNGLLRLASLVSGRYRIGYLTARQSLIPNWREILPGKLMPVGDTARDFALGYASGRIEKEGDDFVRMLPVEEWTEPEVAEFALALNVGQKTWELLRKRKPNAEILYWKRANPFLGQLSVEEFEEAARCLLKAGKPVVVVGALCGAIHSNKKPDLNLVGDTLDAATLSSGGPSDDVPLCDHAVWQLGEVMKAFQNDPGADQIRVAALEWRLLPLARHRGFVPKTLLGEISRNAGFFAELISLKWHPKSIPREQREAATPEGEYKAEAARKLLESWQTIPGTRPDGSVDASVLKEWVEAARKLCADSDRIEVCDLEIGEVLSRSRDGTDGCWPCEEVRDILDSVSSDEILRGFDCGKFNQRGFTSRSLSEGGEQERILVKQFTNYATKCRLRWPRTALALRRMADGYEKRARHEDARADARDL